MGKLVRDDRKATVTQINTRYNQGMQNTISERTTRQTLKQMGISINATIIILFRTCFFFKQSLITYTILDAASVNIKPQKGCYLNMNPKKHFYHCYHLLNYNLFINSIN